MSSASSKVELFALVGEINDMVEAEKYNDTKARAELLTKISKLRDAVETPLDSFLRIYLQVCVSQFNRLPSY